MMVVESAEHVQSILEMAGKLEQYVQQAAQEGVTLHEVEQKVLGSVLQLGHRCLELFIANQGDGDLGESVKTEEGQVLQRSAQPLRRRLRTVFGEHRFSAYVYAAGAKKKVALRAVDARMSLPAGEYSYLLEEFSQYFCIEHAFGKAQQALEKVLGQRVPVETLERINRRVGEEAEAFLDRLPAPPAQEEGALLVLTSDGKGVPMIRPEAAAVPAFEQSERRGNRRVATLASVYSVDRFVRTPQEVLAALFREGDRRRRPDRPRPCHKRMVARFAHVYEDGEGTIEVSGAFEALSWAAAEVFERRRAGQTLIRLKDGQESLWEASTICLGEEHADAVDILDIVHVAHYVWKSAKAFFGGNRVRAEAFTRDRLLRILRGQVRGVIHGLRRMARARSLRGQARKDALGVCRYFENNAERMHYDEYLAEGYPIATGVIEGACRHLVKDRMQRSGMRWMLSGAQPMLSVRAVSLCDQWDAFQQHRIEQHQQRLHPHRILALPTNAARIAA
jgi:hypothetical protein